VGQVQFINNEGGGFSERVQFTPNETIAQFIARNVIGRPGNYNIRINNQEVSADTLLRDGDRVSAVARPGTVHGARQLVEGDRLTVTPKNVPGALKALANIIRNLIDG
jgi:hypothetical protein